MQEMQEKDKKRNKWESRGEYLFLLLLIRVCRFDEAEEEWCWPREATLQFRMGLRANIIGMIRPLREFDEEMIRTPAGEA